MVLAKTNMFGHVFEAFGLVIWETLIFIRYLHVL